MSVEVFVEHQSMLDREFAQEWDELADRVSAPPFLRPDWFALWAKSVSTPLTFLSARRNRSLAAVLPLVRRGRSAASPTNDHTPIFDVLADDEDAATVLIRSLLDSGVSQVMFDYVDLNTTGLRALRRAAGEAGWRLAVRDWERPPYVTITGTWEDYEASLNRKLTRDLERRHRRLAELGAVRLDVDEGRENLGALLDEGFALEPSGWKAARGTAIISRPETRRFYTGLAQWAAGRDTLRLAFLRLDERPLAFQLAIEDAGAYFFVKGGYDPDYGRFSPAKLLVRELLRQAFSSGLRRYEFLGPPDPFKLEWTVNCHDLKRVRAFGRSPAAVASWAAAAYGRPTAARVARALRQQAQHARRRRTASPSPPHS